ncbi:hypothetical protein TWF718_001648 [Orbilia javanica]|uniref:Uncharacterized protein n=1 Tax=Orbilia javanica TaxID=47235 RepID=A0AAN8N9Z6_9PEZI
MYQSHWCPKVFLHLILLSRAVISRVLLSKDGPGRLLGFEGLAYQAIRYEPLCGNLGRAYPDPIDTGLDSNCRPAIGYFVNTTDHLAFYDITGQELNGVRVGGGRDLCMCFAMRDSIGSTFAGALCVWVYGDDGQAEDTGGSVLVSYRPRVEVDKALPVCGGSFDLEAARETWSRTAVQVSAGGVGTIVGSTASVIVQKLGTATKEITKIVTTTVVNYSVTTYLPSVIPSIRTIIYTTTGINGMTITVTSATNTEKAMVTVFSTSEGQENQGLSSNAKLSLGLGLGIGLPIAALVLVVLYILLSKARRNSKAQCKVEPGSLGTGIISGSTTGGTYCLTS